MDLTCEGIGPSSRSYCINFCHFYKFDNKANCFFRYPADVMMLLVSASLQAFVVDRV